MQIFRTPVSLKKFLLLAGVGAVCVLWGDAAYAAATPGDFLVQRNASDATTNLPDGAVMTDLTWDTQVAATGTSVSYSGGTFTLAAGKYLVMYNESFVSSEAANNERIEIQGRLVVGGTVMSEGAGQGYIRTRGYTQEAIVSGSAILDILSDNTTLQTRFYRTDNSTDNTTVRNAGRGGVTIVALDTGWNYAQYEISTDTAMPDTFGNFAWDTNVQQDTGFSRTGGAITVSTSGRYLVSYSIPIQASNTDRTEYVGRLAIDGSMVEGTQVSTYIRGSDSTQDGVLTYIGVVDVSTGGALSLQVDRTDGTQYDALAGSNIQILQLPVAAETFIVTGSGGINDMDPSTESQFSFDTVAHMDVSSFTNLDAATVEVDAADDYLIFASVAADSGDSVRAYSIGRFSVNDTPLGYGAAGEYNRNSGANNAGYAFGAMLPGLTIGDDISLEVQGVGQNTGAMDSDHAAMSGIRLSTMFGTGPTLPPYDVTYSFDPQTGADSGWIFDAPSGTGLQNSDTRAYWSWDSNGTASSGVGPNSGQAGTGDGYVYTETSSPGAVNDVYTMTMANGVDGSLYELNVDFWISADNNNQPITIEAQAWDGSQWNTLLNRGGGSDPAWTNYNYDLSAYENTDVKVQFVVTLGATGTTWNNDIGIDTVRMYGFPRIINGGIMTVHDTPFDNEKTPDTTPDFEVTGNDPDGTADLRYQLQISTDSTFATQVVDCASDGCTTGAGMFVNTVSPEDTSPFNDNQRVRFTPTTTLSNDTTYWWRVRTLDELAGGGTGLFGNWTDPMSFTIDTTLENSMWFQTTDEQFSMGTFQTAQTTGSGQVGLVGGAQTVYELMTGYSETGWGTNQSNSGDPYNTYYMDSRMQSIYLASDLIAAGLSPGMDIVGLQLKGYQVPGRPTLANFRVRLKQTTATTMSNWEGGWSETYGPTGILAGDISDGTWNEFTLPTKFSWDGTSNLMIDFSRDDSSWVAGGGMYIRTGVGTARAVSGYCDSCQPELYSRTDIGSGDNDKLETFVPSLKITAEGAGSIMSPPITFSKFSGAPIRWGQVTWSETETTGTVDMSVYYSVSGTCDTLVPDGVLAGNSAGFSTSGVNLSALSTSTYGEICIEAQLAAGTPTLNSWGVSVQYLDMSQESFAWYTDNNSLNPVTRWGTTSEDESIDWTQGQLLPTTSDELRLRLGLLVGGTTAMPAGTANFKLQFQNNSVGDCTTGTWIDVAPAATWEFANSGVADGTTISSARLSGTARNGVYAKSNPTADTTVLTAVGEQAEFDFHLIGTNTISATQYAFRVVMDDGTPLLGGYPICPMVATLPMGENFLRHGSVFTSGGAKKGFFWAN